MLDDISRMGTRLLRPLNDKLRVEGEVNHSHLVISWQDGPSDIEQTIGHPPSGRHVIDHKPTVPMNGAATQQQEKTQ